MSIIRPLRGKTPQLGREVWLAETAILIGDVVLGDHCSVWYNALVRGDVNSITIGTHVNIQDGAIIHCTFEKAATRIGNYVSIGHAAIVHGCVVEDFCLIGMGAKILDHAVIMTEVMIAAGALVLENTICESGYLYAGVPARKIKALTPAQLQLIRELPERYVMYSGWYGEE